MKLVFSVVLTWVLMTPLFSQTANVGKMITAEGTEVPLYQRVDKKINTSRMKKGCDCQLTAKNTFLYSDKEGKINKINQGKINQIMLNEGTMYCSEAITGIPGGMRFDNTLKLELPEKMQLLSLPFKKKGGAKVLQNILYENEGYILTMYQERDLDYIIYIFTAGDREYVTGRYKYNEVGYGKDGKKALSEIKKYFKDCAEMLEIIDETLVNNKKVKRREMVPVLQNIKEADCK